MQNQKTQNGGGGERDQPERVSGFETQWACPDAHLIVADVFKTLSRVSDSTCWRRLSGILLGTPRFVPRWARAIAILGASRPGWEYRSRWLRAAGLLWPSRRVGKRFQNPKGRVALASLGRKAG